MFCGKPKSEPASKPTPPCKPTDREAEKRAAEERLEQSARDQTQAIRIAQPERLALFKTAYDAQVSGYAFSCKRFGDFLSVFITYVPAPGKLSVKFSTTINLATSREISLTEGSVPKMDGVCSFTEYWCNFYGNGIKEVKPTMMNLEESFSAFELADEKGQYYTDHVRAWASMQWSGFAGYYRYSIKHTIPDCAVPANPDRIRFTGPDAQLYIPAGLGQGVYDAILAELAA